MCLRPINLRDDDGRYRQVPCGRCNACLMRARAEWAFRVRNEWRNSDYAYFVTLTYDNMNLPIAELIDEETGAYFYSGVVLKKDVQLFIHYLRRKFPKKSLRYYAISEYGNKGRSHYHMILFFKNAGEVSQEELLRKIKSIWKSPEVSVGPLDEGGVLYATTYCFDRWQSDPGLPPNFRLMSRNPGIGANYVDTHKEYLRSGMKFVVYDNGFVNLPRYYRLKVYTPDELNERFEDMQFKISEEIRKRVSDPSFDPESFDRKRKKEEEDYIRQTNKTIYKKKYRSKL